MGRAHSLFLKPSLDCTARCAHCDRRRSFYRTRTGPALSSADFRRVILEAKALGAGSLHLSGGEPTLYAGLVDLVDQGRRAHMFTVLNSNASLVTRDLAADLLRAGLDSVIVSLHSHRREKHDSIKRRTGNFDEVVSAIGIFRELRDTRHRRFLISTQTIVTRENWADLPDILSLVCSLDVDAHGISYLEGDFALEHTPTAADIAALRREVIPEIDRRLARHRFKHPLLKLAARRLVRRLYRGDEAKRRDMSMGIYRRRPRSGRCGTPDGFIMVLADGSVLPCNMVEYTNGPVLGNARDRSLGEIVRDQRWRQFAAAGYEHCLHCPTRLHFHIPISTSLGKILPLLFRNPAHEQKSIPTRLAEAVQP